MTYLISLEGYDTAAKPSYLPDLSHYQPDMIGVDHVHQDPTQCTCRGQ